MQKFDVIIIGAGIAGMTAAIYARRANKSVLILESTLAGGQIINATGIKNWPGETNISGEKLTEKIYHQMNNFHVDFRFEKVEKVEKLASPSKTTNSPETAKSSEITLQNDPKTTPDQKNSNPTPVSQNPKTTIFQVTSDESTYLGRSVIVATGSRDKPLGVENEKALIGNGLSYCVTCDGELFKGQDVAVVGGGNTALYDVLYLANLARKIYLIHRRREFRADAILVDQVKKLTNVQIITNAQFNLGVKNGQVSYFTAPDRDLPKANTTATPTPISGVFVAVGRTPDTASVKNLVDLDQNGYIIAGEDGKTSVPGLFTAGDCRTKEVRQLITASSDGASAATSAINYLNS